MSNPSTLMKVWIDEPIPLDFYTTEEKEAQQRINEKATDGIITYSPIEQEKKWTEVDYEEITPFTWKWIDFELSKPDGTITKIHLRRPHWWMRELGADKVGNKVSLSMPELGIDGVATVTNIRLNQLDTRFWDEERNGDYVSRPITGKFEHESSDVYHLYFEGNKNPLGVTGNHPFWSIDRNEWISTKELTIGERVKTYEGIIKLKHGKKLEGKHTVYNLEVYKEHNFLVSTDKILVHNSCFKDLAQQLGLSEGSTSCKFKKFKMNGEYYKFGSHHTEGRWYSKLKNRGWTKRMFKLALSSGITEPGHNKVTGGPATWHLAKKGSDMRILIDNKTNEIIQVGGKGMKYKKDKR